MDAALAIYLGAYSFVAACFALALYALLQPTTSHNPGLAAYDPPPRTIISYVLPARLNGNPETDGYAAAAIEPERTIPEQPAKEAAKTEEARPQVKAQAKPRRAAARPREQRSPGWDYAARPFAGTYRPWF